MQVGQQIQRSHQTVAVHADSLPSAAAAGAVVEGAAALPVTAISPKEGLTATVPGKEVWVSCYGSMLTVRITA